MRTLVAMRTQVLAANPDDRILQPAAGVRAAPTCLAAGPGGGAWRRVTAGWPEPPDTTAPLLAPGRAPDELWAADERGVHRSVDGGRSWERTAAFQETPAWIRGLALIEV